MDSYKVSFKRSAEKDLRRLPKSLLPRVVARIEALAEEPLPRQAVKLVEAEKLYRLRVGEYRIIYEVDTEARELIIHYIRHRREAYRRL